MTTICWDGESNYIFEGRLQNIDFACQIHMDVNRQVIFHMKISLQFMRVDSYHYLYPKDPSSYTQMGGTFVYFAFSRI